MPTSGPLTEEQQEILKAYEQSLIDDGKATRTIQSYLSDHT
ncbi:hypothetical protein [Desulfallas thermosapovorans]|uniref:Uncharacterized protein n=1 Tax=Desulfallas thermosapovorans DSM 6562 TaxID=1121431 RepID=A0A5S4ZRH5_9FIRM|nr:hypothetical protein [Desulfallas thermosapovorans]TYO95507.1 hypothetical protein LX24_01468 [Desulfallas thermosapovorans DSM 6562]